ncbi:MAG: hypothetical protein AAFO01_15790 [Pseudomonadota bacterium]
MLLVRMGAKILMIDKAEARTDTLTIHALLRGDVTLLDRFGVLNDMICAGTPAVRQDSFAHDGEQTTVDISFRSKPSSSAHVMSTSRVHQARSQTMTA